MVLLLLPLRCPPHFEIAAVALTAPDSLTAPTNGLEGATLPVAMALVLDLPAAVAAGKAATELVLVAVAAAAAAVASRNRPHCLMGTAVERQAQAHIANRCTSQSQLQRCHS